MFDGDPASAVFPDAHVGAVVEAHAVSSPPAGNRRVHAPVHVAVTRDGEIGRPAVHAIGAAPAAGGPGRSVLPLTAAIPRPARSGIAGSRSGPAASTHLDV